MHYFIFEPRDTGSTHINVGTNVDITLEYYDGIPTPVFSHTSGFFDAEFYLELYTTMPDSHVIRFTTDGSIPTVYSPIFSAPLHIYSPAATLENSPMMMGARPGNVRTPYYNGMIVRARAFDQYGNGSATITQSFFVSTRVNNRTRGNFNMRVVSISVPPWDFVSPTGMYQMYNLNIRRLSYVEVFYPGGEPMLSQYAELRVAGNWSRRERKKSLRLNFNRGDGIVESLSLIPDTFQGFYPHPEPVSNFRHVTLRTADLHYTTMREALTDRITEPLRTENQNAIPAAVFINGEFWGMYCMREHRSRTFIAARYPGMSEDSVVILDFAWNTRNSGDHTSCTSACRYFDPLQLYPLNPCMQGVHERDGPFGPWLDANGHLPRSHPMFRVDLDDGRSRYEAFAFRSWMRMYNAITGGRVYCDTCMVIEIVPRDCNTCRFGLDMSNPQDFMSAMEFVCFDNLIDYFIAYYHLDNWDWPGNNFLTWKSVNIYEDIPTGDGKWRFIIHDFDNALWHPRRNNMELFTTPSTARGAGTGDAPSHRIQYYHDNQPLWAVEKWRNLFESEIFRNTFAARYATYTGTVFHQERINQLIRLLENERRADIGASFHRWDKHGGDVMGSLVGWQNSIERLRYFTRLRTRYAQRHIIEYFNRVDRPNLGLGLSGEFVNIRWQTESGRGFFDIAGAIINPALFTRDGMVTFDPHNFAANYIWELPIDVTAHALDGYVFSHFEVRGVVTKTVDTPSMVIDLRDVPLIQGGYLVVVAVFE